MPLAKVNGININHESAGKGKPVVFLHGGPGSGCEPWHRRFFDPAAYRIVQEALSNATRHSRSSEVLVRAWHPIIELESLSPQGIREGQEYWRNLPGLDDRFKDLETTEVMTGEISRRELARMGIVTDEDFSAILDKMWRELKDMVGKKGEVSYWKFITVKSFEETVIKAWLVSFLVSYGYATLEVKPLEEEIILRPLEKPQTLEHVAPSSVPISISREEWLRRRQHG